MEQYRLRVPSSEFPSRADTTQSGREAVVLFDHKSRSAIPFGVIFLLYAS
jgi:hypothetical protein